MKREMTVNEYQESAMTTCMKESNNFSYMALNQQGESGEFASKVAKAIRKNKAVINNNQLELIGTDEENAELVDELKKELGDELWQLSGKCTVMGWSLEEVAQMNLDKLQGRKTRGVIEGNGDNR